MYRGAVGYPLSGLDLGLGMMGFREKDEVQLLSLGGWVLSGFQLRKLRLPLTA